ncbi:MAG TPA: BON domain-containing protein [Pirellulales bacterium]|nr:BON domain-containing protein [Pirellulales bacterium]
MSTIHGLAAVADANRRLADRVRTALVRLQVPAFRALSVEVRAGTVHLDGDVGSFYEKQLARACSRAIPGVFHVIDTLRVVDRTSDSGPRRAG